MIHRAGDFAHLQEVSRRNRLIQDERCPGNDVLERLLGRKRDGDAANAKTGKRRRRIDAEMSQSREHPDEDDQDVHGPAQDANHRLHRGATSSRQPASDVGFEFDD